MKILTIMSSPHKEGNTAILMNKILTGVKEHISIEYKVESINLMDFELTPCTGCFDCMKELYCQHCEDTSNIVKNMLQSQLIIIGTPIFFFNMTTYLKTLWDHLVMVTHPDLKPKIINKKFAFFSVAGSNYKGIAKSFYIDIEETARFFQFDILDTFKVGGFWESGSIQEDKDILKDAYNFGKKISEEAKF